MVESGDGERAGFPREDHVAFGTRHPAVPAAFSAITLVLTMSSLQPVLVAISLCGGFAYSCCSRGPLATIASLRWQVPFVVVVALFNPLFSASGSTELFRLGSRAVYLESLCYGATMGGLFVASTLWFSAAARLVPYDKVLALFGRAAPTCALMVSQCMRLIPRFVRQGRIIWGVQESVTLPGAALGDVVRRRLRMSSVLMGWTMEDSLETADAMRARGWASSSRRTTYSLYRFLATDAACLIALAAFGALAAAAAWAATSQFRFYPTMSSLVAWWGYVPYALWMLAPTALQILEGRMAA